MRAISVIFILVSFLGFTQDNKNIRSKVVSGVPVNAQVKKVPELLIQAYASGDLIGYYPNGVDTASYRSMLAHFGLFEEAATHFDVGCEHKVQLPALVEDCMTLEFDLIETVQFNKQTQVYDKKPEAVQVLFSSTCPDNLTGVEQDAVYFKLSDINELPQSYEVINVKNDAERFGIAEVLQLKLYEATPVKRGDWLEDPKTEGKEVKEEIIKEADETQAH